MVGAPTAEHLSETMRQYSQARSQLLQSARQYSARRFAEAVARFHTDGSVKLPDEPEPPPAEAVPLAVLGGPLPASQWNLLDTIEAAGGRIVLNATEPGERTLGPVFQEEDWAADPTHALARRYFESIVDVFQRPNTRLYDWLGHRLRAHQVRGIVLWHYLGCDLWRGEAQSLREAFRLPVLLLDADEVQSGALRDAGPAPSLCGDTEVNTLPRKLTLEEWDDRYAQLRRAGLREPAYGGPLRRHVSTAGDLRLRHLRFDNSAAALRLWNFLLTENERLRQARAQGERSSAP